MFKPAINASVIFALLAVILGAMGAHELKKHLTAELLSSFDTGVKYQFYHSFALLFAGVLHLVFPSKWIKRATWCFITGIILFSGSIYTLVYLQSTSTIGLGGLGILTPIGGLFFILGWLFLLFGINKRKTNT